MSNFATKSGLHNVKMGKIPHHFAFIFVANVSLPGPQLCAQKKLTTNKGHQSYIIH